MTETFCPQCAKRFTPSRAGMVFCSGHCRSAAFRSRHGITVGVTPAVAFLVALDNLILTARAMLARASPRHHQWRHFLREFISRAKRKRSAAAAAEIQKGDTK